MTSEQKLATLIMQRELLSKRVKAGKAGVATLRVRLGIATKAALAFELWMNKHESETL